ncbi:MULTISPECIES: methionine--tRNA ligase [unclassified Dyella]|uniref:methionine--tRNA ligase n=1 Tax=unclassified Dyella TaxID=2634549 RepID=UPI000C84B71E|nr:MULTISPECIES: methionine--tRNA ligase [unclassified Dyella]MDR3446232.1 methionine--tRNA ligase [Dyella sp.]PMQ02691.1 Methionine--tRNA ligase [Dyella sp. AD56]
MSRRLLVTNALPYANGPLHLGHLLGYIQADIWVRAQRMQGNEAIYVCADDAHGTPIMLAAEKAGLSPETYIEGIRVGHEADFAAFGVAFDHYHSTHSEENRELASLIYTRLRDGGFIARRDIQQLFDPEKEMFLPDRYIKGTCPNCKTPDQYGDNCENCGATYAPTDLINPYSVMSGATPVLRDSEHFFFELGKFETLLRDWFAGKFTNGQPVANSGVAAKLREWLDGGLKDWDISRDAPYFGFPIPDEPGKFFYVWLDAPVGYLASFKALCDRTDLKFEDFLSPDSRAEMHHFIGKDIINFHGLFWPAMLHGANFRVPTALHVNGYLMVNGAKMSKSRGTFIMARTYLDSGLHPEFLRYYFTTMLSDAPVDVDLDLKTFEERVNSHLVGKWVNIASRTAGFVHKFFDGRLAPAFSAEEQELWRELLSLYGDVPAFYNSKDFAEMSRRFVTMADMVNGYIAAKAPWAMAKDEALRGELHQVCSFALAAFRLLAGVLKPVVPATVEAAERFLAAPITGFDDARAELHNHTINAFEPLLGRIDPKQVEAMVEASKDSLAPIEAKPAPKKAKEQTKTMTEASTTPATDATAVIGIDDFAKLDLRIGKVTACEFVDGSDKLLRFELDAGTLGTRQIFSGIRAAYGEPEKLVGRNVVFIANLAPRKMRFGLSEGMILSAGDGGSDLFLLDADQGATPGATVR